MRFWHSSTCERAGRGGQHGETREVEECVVQMAGRGETWSSGLEAGYQRGRLVMRGGRIVFLFRVFESFCVQARMFQDKHAPENVGERGAS